MMETESGCGINRTKNIGVVWSSQKNGRWQNPQSGNGRRRRRKKLIKKWEDCVQEDMNMYGFKLEDTGDKHKCWNFFVCI